MRTGIFATLCVLLVSCSGETVPTNTGVYMLLDTSGHYTEELEKAEQIIRYTLSKLDSQDTFAVARIDTGSFSEKDIIAKASFDDRPSAVNRQKRMFAQQVSEFVKSAKPSSYTDITGGLLQAVFEGDDAWTYVGPGIQERQQPPRPDLDVDTLRL